MTKSMTVATRVPAIPLNNGVQLRALGLGVFQSPPEPRLGIATQAWSHSAA